MTLIINRSNCKKLAAYLATLPDTYENFGMQSYLDMTDVVRTTDYARGNAPIHECGTVACAVGHGPAAGIPVPEGSKYWTETSVLYVIDPDTGEEHYVRGRFLAPYWGKYSHDMFVSGSYVWWDWCFGSGWRHADNTPKGAAARIQYMLTLTDQGKSLPEGPRGEFNDSHLDFPEVAEFYLDLYQ